MARRKRKNSRGLGEGASVHDDRAGYAYQGAEQTVSNMPVNCYGAVRKIAQAAAELAAARAHAWAAVNAEGSNARRSAILGKINKLQKKLDAITDNAQSSCKGSIR